MEMKKESNILTEEKPKYIISLKKRYRILYIVIFGVYDVFWSDITLCRYRYDDFWYWNHSYFLYIFILFFVWFNKKM